jgi:hypothetical protein
MIEGAVHQGIDGPELAPGVRPNLFVQINFAADTERLDYNNKARSAVGAQLRFTPAFWISFELGVKHEWDYRWVTDRTPSGWVGFANWGIWRDWPARTNSSRSPLRYILSSWGQVRYPSSHELAEERNAIAEGAVELSADWWRIERGPTFNTFVSLDFKADSQKFEYNNEIEPAVGARFWMPITKYGRAELGAKLVNEQRFRTGGSYSGAIAFVGFSARW